MYKYLLISLLTACASGRVQKPAKVPQEPASKERTLWQICHNAPGEVVGLPSDDPPHTPPCTEPHQIVYKTLPVPVYAVGEGWLPAFLAKFSVAWWNEQLGFHMLEYRSGDIPEGTLEGIALYLSPQTGWLLGQAFPVWGGEKYYCVAGVFKLTQVTDNTAAHEVGHCLGLAHDADLEESVMYPYGSDRDYFLTAADRNALRKLYGVR